MSDSLPTPYYDRDGITLYHADCRDVLPKLEPKSVDLVLTDPPYGIDFSSHGQRFCKSAPIAGDASSEVGEHVIQWARRFRLPVAAFSSPDRPWSGNWRNRLVWSKGAHVGVGGDRATCWKRDWELILVADNRPLNGQRDSAVININAISPPTSGHFAEKPEALMRYLVRKLSQPGDLVLDPFAGSGTTLRAAMDLGRRAIGIELSEEYCEMTVRRLRQRVLFPQT